MQVGFLTCVSFREAVASSGMEVAVPLEQLHETIRRLRSRRGMTQAELASAVGMSERQIQRWETGDASAMQVGAFARLADVLVTDAAEWQELLAALQRLGLSGASA
jgi:transcriptional regulator with XRE-family HTH domain